MKQTQKISEANASKYLSVGEASRMMGITAPVLRNYLYKGKITTYKFKNLTLLKKKEVEKWVQDKRR